MLFEVSIKRCACCAHIYVVYINPSFAVWQLLAVSMNAASYKVLPIFIEAKSNPAKLLFPFL